MLGKRCTEIIAASHTGVKAFNLNLMLLRTAPSNEDNAKEKTGPCGISASFPGNRKTAENLNSSGISAPQLGLVYKSRM